MGNSHIGFRKIHILGDFLGATGEKKIGVWFFCLVPQAIFFWGVGEFSHGKAEKSAIHMGNSHIGFRKIGNSHGEFTYWLL